MARFADGRRGFSLAVKQGQTAGMEPSLARRIWTALEPYHAVVYFAPETAEAAKAVGLKGWYMGYFAQRAAPMGPVSAPVVTATFFNFHPRVVARAIPDAWTFASPQSILDARMPATDAALRRLLDDVIGSDALREAAALAVEAASACVTVGRPLAAAWQAVPIPVETHMALWWATTVLREHRGDGHIAALVEAGLDGCEALVTAAAAGSERGGVGRQILQSTRSWSDDEWDAAVGRLAHRGIVDFDGTFTDAGREQRRRIEQRTDELAVSGYSALSGEEGERLATLMAPVAQAIGEAGGIPWPNPMGVGRPT